MMGQFGFIPPMVSAVSKDDQMILCVPRTSLAAGLHSMPPSSLLGSACFRRRGSVEHDERWQQVIPYVVVRRAGKYLMYNRGGSGGEERLADKWSVGWGGHVEESDCAGSPSVLGLYAALYRELAEELVLTGQFRLEADRILVCDKNPVDRVHIGFVYQLNLVDSGDASSREGLTTRWVGLSELAEVRLEEWSYLLVCDWTGFGPLDLVSK